MSVSFVYFLSKLARNKGTKSRTERGLEFEDVKVYVLFVDFRVFEYGPGS